MVSKMVAMITGKDNHCILNSAVIFHFLKQTSQMIINLLDQSHISWNNGFTNFITTESLALVLVHECLINRMRIFFFLRMAFNRKAIFSTIHIIIGS